MDESKSNEKKMLLEVNDLSYPLPANLSQCTSSNFVKEQITQGTPVTVSGGTKLTHILNTGKSFVDGAKSALFLKIKLVGAFVPATDFASFGLSSSALNCIKSVILVSKDGKEVDRVEGSSLQNIHFRYKNSRDWQKTNGSALMAEFPDGDTTANGGETGVYSGEIVGGFLDGGFYAVIPMKYLSSLFDTGKMLPPQLMSGLSIQMELHPKETVFLESTALFDVSTAAYTVEDAYFRIATCEVNDLIASEVSKISAKEGLKILFDAYYHQQESGIVSRANLNIRANISQVKKCIIKTRQSAFLADATKDSNSASGCNISNYQFRHGNMSMPASRVDNLQEVYYQSMIAFDRVERGAGMSYLQWFEEGRVVAYNFEKSADLGLSGVSISNSKSLMFDAEFSDGLQKTVDLFLVHDKLLSVYLSNVVIQV